MNASLAAEAASVKASNCIFTGNLAGQLGAAILVECGTLVFSGRSSQYAGNLVVRPPDFSSSSFTANDIQYAQDNCFLDQSTCLDNVALTCLPAMSLGMEAQFKSMEPAVAFVSATTGTGTLPWCHPCLL